MDLGVALRGSRTASANAVRMPRKHGHDIVLGVKYLKKNNLKRRDMLAVVGYEP